MTNGRLAGLRRRRSFAAAPSTSRAIVMTGMRVWDDGMSGLERDRVQRLFYMLNMYLRCSFWTFRGPFFLCSSLFFRRFFLFFLYFLICQEMLSRVRGCCRVQKCFIDGHKDWTMLLVVRHLLLLAMHLFLVASSPPRPQDCSMDFGTFEFPVRRE